MKFDPNCSAKELTRHLNDLDPGYSDYYDAEVGDGDEILIDGLVNKRQVEIMYQWFKAKEESKNEK